MAVMPLLMLLAAAPVVVHQCDRVEVIGPEEKTAVRIAKIVCGRKKNLDALFGVKSRVRVRVCGDMQCWRKRSGRPWYISAALVGDEEILTQPARSLEKLENLEGTLVHELVNPQAGRTQLPPVAGRGPGAVACGAEGVEGLDPAGGREGTRWTGETSGLPKNVQRTTGEGLRGLPAAGEEAGGSGRREDPGPGACRSQDHQESTRSPGERKSPAHAAVTPNPKMMRQMV